MKRFAALLLTIFLSTASFPFAAANAADTVKAIPVKLGSAVKNPAPSVQAPKPLLGKDSLEKAITLIKSRLVIPEAFNQFNSDVFDNGGKTAFRLRWYTDGNYGGTTGSLEVTVDEDGVVNNYYYYMYDRNYDYGRRLTKISTAQALDRAKKFVAEMSPDIAGQISFDTAFTRSNIEYDGSFTFNFYRVINGLPFYDNYITVQVDGQNGQVRNMYRSWDGSLVLPEAGKTISVEKAKAEWKDKIGLKLRYKIIWNQGSAIPVLRYATAAVDSMFAIDAVTGDKISVNMTYNPYFETNYRPGLYYGTLSGSELDEIKELKGLMDSDKGEKLARSMPELGLDSSYRMNRYTYSKTGTDAYSLQLEFTKAVSPDSLGKDIPPEKLNVMIAAGEGGGYATVVFDAVTSELVSFNGNSTVPVTSSGKSLTRADLQKKVEAFLGKYKAARFKQTELSENAPAMNDYMLKYGIPGPQGIGSFIYSRKVNGIIVEDNGLYINVDPVSGRITSYSEVWDDVTFPQATGIIGIDKAYEALFNQNGLELKYVTVVNNSNPADVKSSLLAPGKPVQQRLKAVYSPGNNKPVIVDAHTGALINGMTGEEFIDKNTVSFSDLEGNAFRSEIEKMARSGLLAVSSRFRPDEAILQKDFLYMLYLLRGSSLYGMTGGEMNQTAEDGMYRQLINEGMIHESEREPDAAVTKIQAVKLLLKSTGYTKFAEMKGIFNLSFTDKADIAPELQGYAAIASSLGIVEGTAFEPAKKLTRAEAAMLIYRYVNR